MKSKLTLRLDQALIKRAKKKAKQRGTSVSQMVADYFSLFESELTEEKPELPPITASLAGILRNSDLEEEDYQSYLEERYLK